MNTTGIKVIEIGNFVTAYARDITSSGACRRVRPLDELVAIAARWYCRGDLSARNDRSAT